VTCTDSQWTDEELTALAMAADPDAPIDPYAVPLSLYPEPGPNSLPVAYMPPAMSGVGRGWRVPVAVIIILAFLAIDAVGLCITYGTLVAA
jgi:hypothetical protein